MSNQLVPSVLDELQDAVHAQNAHWWKELDLVLGYLPESLHEQVKGWFHAAKIALIHSEVSEMLEGRRKGLDDDHLPHFKMETVEFADILIRMFDYGGARRLKTGQAFVEKLEYNQQRADHKDKARAAPGGKKF